LKAVVYTFIASQLYSNKDKEILLKAFKEIDKDGDGVIERDELIKTFSDSSTNLLPAEVERILEIIDTNGSGRIDFTEFLVAASNE
jgi:calcium-dependent protein kinase